MEASTRLLIAPGYRFRLVQGLITNFHQPESTLLLLVAALLGPGWRAMYEHALRQDYRFLSYGDSSLLLPNAEQDNSGD
ncbi:MAG: S-adenosylmethionine:tRNA ribosyltransferase-isomerase [Hymenobacter sp.]